MKTVRRVVAAVLFTLTVAAAGCGGNDKGGVKQTPTTAKSSGPSTTRSYDYGG